MPQSGTRLCAEHAIVWHSPNPLRFVDLRRTISFFTRSIAFSADLVFLAEQYVLAILHWNLHRYPTHPPLQREMLQFGGKTLQLLQFTFWSTVYPLFHRKTCSPVKLRKSGELQKAPRLLGARLAPTVAFQKQSFLDVCAHMCTHLCSHCWMRSWQGKSSSMRKWWVNWRKRAPPQTCRLAAIDLADCMSSSL